MEEMSVEKTMSRIQDLKILEAGTGFLRCSFVGVDRLSCDDFHWGGGGMAMLMAEIGAAAVCSTAPYYELRTFHASYGSAPISQEEVEIHAQVVGRKGKLIALEIEVISRDKLIIASGKLWMSPVLSSISMIKRPHQPSRL